MQKMKRDHKKDKIILNVFKLYLYGRIVPYFGLIVCEFCLDKND